MSRRRWVTIQTLAFCRNCDWFDDRSTDHEACMSAARRHHAATGHEISVERGSVLIFHPAATQTKGSGE